MTANTPTNPPLLEHQLCFALYSTSRAFTKLYATLLEDMGVTYPQYLVLLVLWEKGPQSVLQIANALEIEGATATPLIKRMEGLGLVARERSAEDERRVVVSLTAKGESMSEMSCKIPVQLGSAADVGVDQAKKLLNELNAIRKTLNASSL